MFKLFLSVKLHCKFGKDYFIGTHWPFVAPGFNLLAGPLKPFSISCEHVGDNTGVHQNHSSPRVKRSHSLVRPLILPPRSKALSTRLPPESFAALITKLPPADPRVRPPRGAPDRAFCAWPAES